MSIPVSLKNIRKSYGALEVVKGLDLEVEQGEFLVLLGPSGCGKSTALRMIAGLESVTTGEILMDDRDVTHMLPKYRDIAMVFQSYALYPHMTVAENIGYPLKLRRLPVSERQDSIRAAAGKVDLMPYLDRYPRELSGGQRQRVALARAMVRTPGLFLMDEPLSNLDAKLRATMRSELKHLQQELGVTTIYVTHDQIEAMTLAHRVAVMNGGVVQQIDTPRRIYEDPANLFVAGFMGSPPMNFLDGDIASGRFTSAHGGAPATGFGDATGVKIGFRPEDITICAPKDAMFSGVVWSCEMTGNETIVTCHLEKDVVVIRAGKDFSVDANSQIHFGFDPTKACYFDANTGNRLRN